MNRRHVLYGLAAVTAGLAGVGTARWQAGQDRHSIWRLNFETPQGTSLAMAQLLGRPLLLNFWATWCPPCVEELPLLDDFYRKNKDSGWQVLGLAVDQVSAVQRYLRVSPLSFAVALAGSGGMGLSRSLGNVDGTLPFSVVFSPSGELLAKHVGKLSASDLSAWAALR